MHPWRRPTQLRASDPTTHRLVPVQLLQFGHLVRHGLHLCTDVVQRRYVLHDFLAHRFALRREPLHFLRKCARLLEPASGSRQRYTRKTSKQKKTHKTPNNVMEVQHQLASGIKHNNRQLHFTSTATTAVHSRTCVPQQLASFELARQAAAHQWPSCVRLRPRTLPRPASATP